MKAYSVTNPESLGVIVYAPDPALAKKWALHDGGAFDYIEDYTDISCLRCPDLDDLHPEGVVSWETEEGQRIYWDAMWWTEDTSCCANCGYYAFDKVPDSQKNLDGVCAVCEAELTKLPLKQILQERKEGTRW